MIIFCSVLLNFIHGLKLLKQSTCDYSPVTQVIDDVVFLYFLGEMVVKMIALGVMGRGCYLQVQQQTALHYSSGL